MKSSRRALFRGGCFERYWRAQVRAERSAPDNEEEMEEASRRGGEKHGEDMHVFARMSAGDVCDPSDQRDDQPDFCEEIFQSYSNPQRQENKNAFSPSKSRNRSQTFLTSHYLLFLHEVEL